MISIVMGHYSEDLARDAIAIKSAESIQQFRNQNTEFIISANGYYGDELKKYCDLYIERPVDALAGKTANIGFQAARGDVLFFLCNDVLLSPGAVEACAEIVRKYPKYLATPVYPKTRKWHERPPVDGYNVNARIGSDCICMTRTQYEDIGPFDEVGVVTDGVNYTNRWIKKGYAVMMTREPMGTNIGTGTHSFTRQLQDLIATGYKPYNGRKAIFDFMTYERFVHSNTST